MKEYENDSRLTKAEDKSRISKQSMGGLRLVYIGVDQVAQGEVT